MTGIVLELRHAVRQMLRSPGFSALVVITLGLGIGAATAITVLVHGVLLQPLPYPEPEGLVMICETEEQRSSDWCGGSPGNWNDWRRVSRTLATVGLARSWQFSWDRDEGSQSVSGGVATPGLFQTFSVAPAHGRLFEDQDIQPGNEHVVMVSQEFLESQLGGIEDSSLILDGEPYRVVGVLPKGFTVPYLEQVELWIPLWPKDLDDRGWRGFMPFGRLQDGVSLAEARADLGAVQKRLEETHPEDNKGWGLAVESLHERTVRPVEGALTAFGAAVGALLLIACANVASLFLARGTTREREYALRSALGAGRFRLAGHLVSEGVLYAVAGTVVGALLAVWGVGAFTAMAPAWFPRLEEIRTGLGIVALAAVFSLIATALVGVLPVLAASGTQPAGALRDARSLGDRRRTTVLRKGLAVSGIALACLLLVAAGLLMRSFTGLLDWEPGFDRQNLVFFSVFSSDGKYPEGRQVAELYRRAVEEVGSVPGVVRAGAGSAVPLWGGDGDQEYQVEGEPDPGPGQRPRVFWFDAEPGYFETLGVELVRGRFFSAADHRDAQPVAVINETMARRHWPDENPIGKRIEMEWHGGPFQIVGVVKDVKPFSPVEIPKPEIYWPFAQRPRWAVMLMARTTIAPEELEQTIRSRLHDLDPDMEVGRFRTMEDRVAAQLSNPRFNTVILGAFSALATLIAMVGVYGIVSFSVARRTREIGVRMALGASPSSVFGLAARSGMGLAIAGLVVGLLGAFWATRLIESLLIQVKPTDPATFLAIGVLVLLAAFLASYIPARRATRVDPVEALRQE